MTMSKGEKAVLHITSDYGYGARGAGGVIPPNADLDFEGKYNDIIPARPERAMKASMFSAQNHLVHSLIDIISVRTALSAAAQQSSSSRSTKHDCTDTYVRRRMSSIDVLGTVSKNVSHRDISSASYR